MLTTEKQQVKFKLNQVYLLTFSDSSAFGFQHFVQSEQRCSFAFF